MVNIINEKNQICYEKKAKTTIERIISIADQSLIKHVKMLSIDDNGEEKQKNFYIPAIKDLLISLYAEEKNDDELNDDDKLNCKNQEISQLLLYPFQPDLETSFLDPLTIADTITFISNLLGDHKQSISVKDNLSEQLGKIDTIIGYSTEKNSPYKEIIYEERRCMRRQLCDKYQNYKEKFPNHKENLYHFFPEDNDIINSNYIFPLKYILIPNKSPEIENFSGQIHNENRGKYNDLLAETVDCLYKTDRVKILSYQAHYYHMILQFQAEDVLDYADKITIIRYIARGIASSYNMSVCFFAKNNGKNKVQSKSLSPEEDLINKSPLYMEPNHYGALLSIINNYL